MRFRSVAMMLPMAVLATASGVRLAVAQVQPNTSGQVQDSSPPTQPGGRLPDDTQFDLASAGVQAPFSTQYDRHLTIRADRTATDTVTTRLKVLVPSAIQGASQQQLQFIEGMQKLDVVEAFTEKFDGKRVAVDPANIITQDAAAGQQATYLRDQKQKTIIFPDVAVGDTLVWTVHIDHSLQGVFPGQFADIDVFPRNMAVTSAHLTCRSPQGDRSADRKDRDGDDRHGLNVRRRRAS